MINKNIGAYIAAVACGLATATAGGTGDNTEITGATIDRLGYASCQVVAAAKTTLGASETLKFALTLQESEDGSTWDTAKVVYATTTVKTGAVTNGLCQKTSDIDLSGRKRYIRFNLTPNLSASGTDTAVVSCTVTLGGASVLPTVPA